jgi:hypothetical protein
MIVSAYFDICLSIDAVLPKMLPVCALEKPIISSIVRS